MPAKLQAGSSFTPRRSLPPKGLFFLPLLLAAWPIVAGATSYVIHPDGTGDFPTIQAALNAAANGDEVVLTDGTFTGESTLDFHGRAVALRSESDNPRACIIVPHDRGFYMHTGETRQTRVEGITIQGGYDYDQGGGAYLSNASPTFRNCRFEGCCALQGDAIYMSLGSPRFETCVFACGCYSIPDGEGGAIWAGGGSVELVDCHFYWVGTSRGGAIFSWNCDLTLTGCYFGPVFGHDECFMIRGGTARFVSCTVGNVFTDTLFRLEGATLIADHSIFAYGFESMTSVSCDPSSSARFTCCDVFGFPWGNWIQCLEGQLGKNGNLEADPLLCVRYGFLAWQQRMPCTMPEEDLTLHSNSPCAAANNPHCGRIGALDVGCSGPVATRTTTWGQIKSLYR
jgi:hypothetical protein